MKLDEYLWRHRKETSKGQFAKKIGIGEVTLYRMLDGTHEPRVSRALKIVEATGGKVTLQDLVIENGNEDENEEKN